VFGLQWILGLWQKNCFLQPWSNFSNTGRGRERKKKVKIWEEFFIGYLPSPPLEYTPAQYPAKPSDQGTTLFEFFTK